MVCVDGGGQWHVQQHRHSYPVGVRQQLRGRRGGDEPVNQDRLTVGDGGDDAGQVGAGARAGYWRGGGDGSDQHLPAGLGQSGADPPVIDIAAGRLAWVVESSGDYDVDPRCPRPRWRLPFRVGLLFAVELNHTRCQSIAPVITYYVCYELLRGNGGRGLIRDTLCP